MENFTAFSEKGNARKGLSLLTFMRGSQLRGGEMGLEEKTGRILCAAAHTLSSDGGERAWCLLPEPGTVEARPAGLPEAARWAQGSSDSSSTGKWWSASSLPAASVATACSIFARYPFPEWPWFYFCCGHRRRLPQGCAVCRFARLLGRTTTRCWAGGVPIMGNGRVPGQGAGGHRDVGMQVLPAQCWT